MQIYLSLHKSKLYKDPIPWAFQKAAQAGLWLQTAALPPLLHLLGIGGHTAFSSLCSSRSQRWVMNAEQHLRMAISSSRLPCSSKIQAIERQFVDIQGCSELRGTLLVKQCKFPSLYRVSFEGRWISSIKNYLTVTSLSLFSAQGKLQSICCLYLKG